MLIDCQASSEIAFDRSVGPNPHLPEPQNALIPTIKIAKVIGWTDTEKPLALEGFQVTALARNLDHPRWLYALPNGDILVAESNKPSKSAILLLKKVNNAT